MRLIRTIILLSVLLLLSKTSVFADSGAKLEFHQKNISLNVGEQQTISMRLTPQNNRIIGVDLMLRFDPNFIDIVDVTNLGAISSQTGKVIDIAGGRVKYAISNPYGTYLTKPADIVNIVIKGKQAVNKTFVTLDFIQGKTSDTNAVVQGGTDVLTSVDSLEVTVNTASNNNSSSASSSDSPASTPSDTPVVTVTPPGRVKFPVPTPEVLSADESKIISPLADEEPNLTAHAQEPIGEVFGANTPNQNKNWFNLNKEWVWGILILVLLIITFITIKLIRRRVGRAEYDNPY